MNRRKSRNDREENGRRREGGGKLEENWTRLKRKQKGSVGEEEAEASPWSGPGGGGGKVSKNREGIEQKMVMTHGEEKTRGRKINWRIL